MSTTTEMSGSAAELRAQIERQRSDLGRDLDVLGDKVSPGRMVERRREAIRSTARGWKDRMMGVAETTTSTIADTVGTVGERIGQAPEAGRHVAQGNPLAVGLVAFGAGAVLAALIPATERERQLAREAAPVLERAADEAKSVARQAAEEIKPIAQERVEEVKEHAREAVEQVKEEAQGATTATTEAARSAAEEVRTRGEQPRPAPPPVEPRSF